MEVSFKKSFGSGFSSRSPDYTLYVDKLQRMIICYCIVPYSKLFLKLTSMTQIFVNNAGYASGADQGLESFEPARVLELS